MFKLYAELLVRYSTLHLEAEIFIQTRTGTAKRIDICTFPLFQQDVSFFLFKLLGISYDFEPPRPPACE